MSDGTLFAQDAHAVIIGEAFIDLMTMPGTAQLTYIPKFGGSALNVAVGVRRLGTPVSLASTLAPGELAAALRHFCEREGVDITPLSTEVTQGFLAVATPVGGHVTYEFFGDLASLTQIDSIAGPRVERASAVHASSTAFLAEPARSTVLGAFATTAGLRTIDPNPRPNLIKDRKGYLAYLEDLYQEADVVKLSDEDFAYLKPEVTAEQAALALHREHGVTVIVTWAALPTLLAHGNVLTSVGVPPTSVVDATGAGDSFMASLLADVCQYGEPRTSAGWVTYIRRANHVAAATCQGLGGAESMPTTPMLTRGHPELHEE